MSTPTDVKDPIGEEDPAEPKPELGQHEHSPGCEHHRDHLVECAGGCIQTPPPTP